MSGFLRARFDEDEAGAVAARDCELKGRSGEWLQSADGVINKDTATDIAIASALDEWGAYDPVVAEHAAHMARHDPHRVLLEVTAKRAILVQLDAIRAMEAIVCAETCGAECDPGCGAASSAITAALLLPYCDYREDPEP